MILSKVRLKNLNINKELEYMLVSEKEADLKLGKIAISTPIAQGILGHTVGDVVEIAVPSGKLRLEILSIGR
jgi:transcription elongation factor GreA